MEDGVAGSSATYRAHFLCCSDCFPGDGDDDVLVVVVLLLFGEAAVVVVFPPCSWKRCRVAINLLLVVEVERGLVGDDDCTTKGEVDRLLLLLGVRGAVGFVVSFVVLSRVDEDGDALVVVAAAREEKGDVERLLAVVVLDAVVSLGDAAPEEDRVGKGDLDPVRLEDVAGCFGVADAHDPAGKGEEERLLLSAVAAVSTSCACCCCCCCEEGVKGDVERLLLVVTAASSCLLLDDDDADPDRSGKGERLRLRADTNTASDDNRSLGVDSERLLAEEALLEEVLQVLLLATEESFVQAARARLLCLEAETDRFMARRCARVFLRPLRAGEPAAAAAAGSLVGVAGAAGCCLFCGAAVSERVVVDHSVNHGAREPPPRSLALLFCCCCRVNCGDACFVDEHVRLSAVGCSSRSCTGLSPRSCCRSSTAAAVGSTARFPMRRSWDIIL